MDHVIKLLAQGSSDAVGERLAIRWSESHRETLRRTMAGEVPGRVPVDRPLAATLLMCAEGRFSEAERQILELLSENIWACRKDNEIFTSFINALFTVQRLDLVATLLCDRYGCPTPFEIAALRDGLGRDQARWDILPSGEHRFYLDAGAFEHDDTRITILLFQWIFPLCSYYARQPQQEHGSIIINLGDVGGVPGLAFCDNRPDRFLIPDTVFVPTFGYAYARQFYNESGVAWGERRPVAFWRGATTGMRKAPDDWRSLERIKLCEVAQRDDTGLIDAGISDIVQFDDPVVVEEIRRSGLVRDFVPWQAWNGYKYHIDIDGNTNSWSAFFYRLLSGSPVFKVESSRGMMQWFYDRLAPWDNYIPIAPDLSDLIDKIRWVARNDSIAEKIGRRGWELASSMDYDAELARAAPVISAAFCYFNDRATVVGPYGRPA